MANKKRILFGISTRFHIEIGLDEMYGLQEIGYTCDQFEYGGKEKFRSTIARLYIIVLNAIKLLIKTYKFQPDFIYLNSRVEFLASLRDFITILILKVFYFKKIHFLVKSHGSDLGVLKTQNIFFRRIVFPYLKRYIRSWLFLSCEELNWLVSNDLFKEHTLFLTKNIVRPEKFKIDPGFRRKFNIPIDYTILLYVGRLIEQKGIHYVVEAFAEIRKKQNVYLIVVGDGEELESIRSKIENLPFKNDTMTTGWIDESEVAYFTSNCDILVFPSFFPEGFPMALFNSLAAGLAIITTQTRAANDYLQEPQNCLWVQPKSSQSITTALNKLLSDEKLIQRMRLNNKQKAKLFTKSFVSQQLSEILHSINTNEYSETLRKVRR